ncbi:MAG: glycosyltransferase, partial [Planctomycetes bacterium]|nr:glycosyltransferase [Planctomycetota bacterium]
MKILLGAHSCSPTGGSEPGIGWHWATLLSQRHEVHVISAGYSRELIAAELTRNPNPNLHFHYLPPLFEVGAAAAGLGLSWLEYALWQRRAYSLAKELHARFNFDLAHQVTLGSWRAPCFFWKLGIPFVWGPIGGGEEIPRSFYYTLGAYGCLREFLRSLSQKLSFYSPAVRATFREAAAILTANDATLAFLPERYREKAQLVFSIGFDPSTDPPAKRERPPESPIELIWAGMMEPRKGFSLLLEALARLPEPGNFRLAVIGDGPARPLWEERTLELGLVGQVCFLGRRPHAEVQARLRNSDIFVFPSLRDSAGSVVLEAMDAGLPIICLDLGGPGDLATNACAILIRPSNPELVIEDMAAALQ